MFIAPSKSLEPCCWAHFHSCCVDSSDVIGVAATRLWLFDRGRQDRRPGLCSDASLSPRLRLSSQSLDDNKISGEIIVRVGRPGEIDGAVGRGRAPGNGFEAGGSVRGEDVAHNDHHGWRCDAAQLKSVAGEGDRKDSLGSVAVGFALWAVWSMVPPGSADCDGVRRVTSIGAVGVARATSGRLGCGARTQTPFFWAFSGCFLVVGVGLGEDFEAAWGEEAR